VKEEATNGTERPAAAERGERERDRVSREGSVRDEGSDRKVGAAAAVGTLCHRCLASYVVTCSVAGSVSDVWLDFFQRLVLRISVLVRIIHTMFCSYAVAIRLCWVLFAILGAVTTSPAFSGAILNYIELVSMTSML
jgi:hypothetical protein